MAITIRRLQCFVHVVAGTESPILSQGQQAERPSMNFAMTMGAAAVESEEAAPSERPTTRGSSSESQAASMGSPGEVDVHKVTERVYELMRQEVILGRARGGEISNGKRR
jgi:hypothetical protein